MIRTSGLTAALRRWPIVLVVALGQLLLALPTGAFVGAWVNEHVASSLQSSRFAQGLEPLLAGEWLSATPVLSMLPPMLGAVLLLGVVFDAFADALVYDAVGRRDPRRLSESLASGGRYFLRMLRLTLMAFPLHALLVGGVTGGGLWAVEALTKEWPSERIPLALRLFVVGLGCLLAAACVASHALAKAETVVRDEKRVRLALWRGVLQVVRHPVAPWNVTLTYGLLAAVCALALSLVDVRIPRISSVALAAGILLQQSCRILWVVLTVAYAHAMTRLRRAHT